MSKRKAYQPLRRFNPAVLDKRVEKLQNDVEHQQHVIDMIGKSYDRHLELLSNFARHDIGNAVQNLYASIELIKKSSGVDMVPIKAAADAVSKALSTFEDIVPYSTDNYFELSKLMIAVETLSRSNLKLNRIDYQFKYERQTIQKLNQPFQLLLQLLQNLVINSIRAMKDTKEKKLVIEAETTDESCIIKVKDTGCGIPNENLSKIFAYRFTTTENGTGIGLFHSKYIIEKIGGEISVNNNCELFSTEFTIKFPKDGCKKDTCNR